MLSLSKKTSNKLFPSYFAMSEEKRNEVKKAILAKMSSEADPDVANDLAIHVATINRVVMEKEKKSFFSGLLDTAVSPVSSVASVASVGAKKRGRPSRSATVGRPAGRRGRPRKG